MGDDSVAVRPRVRDGRFEASCPVPLGDERETERDMIRFRVRGAFRATAIAIHWNNSSNRALAIAPEAETGSSAIGAETAPRDSRKQAP